MDHNIMANIIKYVYVGRTIKLGIDNQTTEISKARSTAFGRLNFIFTTYSKAKFQSFKRDVFSECVLPAVLLTTLTALNTINTNKLPLYQKAMERAMLGLSLRDFIKTKNII